MEEGKIDILKKSTYSLEAFFLSLLVVSKAQLCLKRKPIK
jgi:hypothetical protein